MHFGHIHWPNGVSLSVQAGPALYSKPKEFLYNAAGYEELEISPPEDVGYEPLKPYRDESDGICAYVPRDVVEGYIAYLTAKYGEPIFVSEPMKGWGDFEFSKLLQKVLEFDPSRS